MRRSFVLLLSLLSATAVDAAITGTLIREDGTPAAGATVRAFARQTSDVAATRLLSDKPDSEPIAATKAGDDGKFSIDVKGAPTVGLMIDLGGAPVAALVAADRDDLGAILIPAQVPRVKVTAAGKPVPNAIVGIGDFAVLRTDASGTVPNVSRAPMTVVAPDFAIASGSEMKSDEIALSRGVAVRGKVVGANDQPVAGATIWVQNLPVAHSASDGTFTVAHAPERWSSIEATTATEAGDATNHGNAPLVIHLRPGASLSGTVVGPSGPVAGAAVSLKMRGDAAPRTALTDAKGAFTIGPMVTGLRSVVALHPLYTTPVREMMIARGTTTQLRLAARGSVRGQVIDENGKAVAGALVLAEDPVRRVTITGAAGEFTLPITVAANSTPRLVAWKNGYATSVRAASRTAATAPVVLKLAHGFPLQLKVIDRDRVPVANAAVAIDTSSDFGRSNALPCSITELTPCRTAADGTIAMRVAAGRYALRISGDAVARRTVNDQLLSPSNNPVVITVDRGAEISGRVTFPDGTPAAGARVYSRRMPIFTSTDANGNFTLRGLPREAIQLNVETADNPPMEAQSAIVTPPARDVAVVLPLPVRVEGRVIDRATGQPVTTFSVGVVERGMAAGATNMATFNSDDGAFVLDRVAPGDVTLRVVAPGYVAGMLSGLTLTAGKPMTGVEVKLDRGMKVSGRVTSAGEPVAGATVSLQGSPMARVNFGTFAQTDDAGEWTLDGVPAGEQTFNVRKDGFAPKQKSIAVEAGKDARLDIELERGAELHGRVTDRAGQPVAGVQLQVASQGAQFASTAFSDDDGAFTVSGLQPAARYTIHTRKAGYVQAAVENIDPASSGPIAITIDRGGTITGHIVGLSPDELGTVHVFAFGSGSQADALADPSGAFTVTGVPDGRITVGGTLEGARPRTSIPKVVQVANGVAPPVELDFTAGITVHGRVTRNGTPLTGGRVAFSPKTAGAHPGNGMIAADGTYEVTGVDPGDYDVRIFGPDMSRDARSYTVSGNAVFDIDLQGGTIRGHVVDANSGEPIPNAAATLQSNPQQPISRRAVTDNDGRFVFEAVPDGTFNVAVEREQYAGATQQAIVRGGDASPLEFKLTGGNEQVIRVVDAENGQPLAGALTIMRDNKVVSAAVRRTDDGAWMVWLDPGTYVVRPYIRGYLQQTATVTVPGPEVKITLARGGAVVLSSKNGGQYRLTMAVQGNSRMVKLPAGTSAFFDSLAPGAWSVDKLDADGVTVLQHYDVTVTAGQTQNVNAE